MTNAILPAFVRKGVLACLLVAVLFSAGAVWAESDYRTPRAGEEYTTTLFGEQVTAPARDRTSETALNLGVVWVADAPKDNEFLPFGAFFLWRNNDEGRERFRGVMAGFYDDIRYNKRPSWLGSTELVFTFENLTIPVDRYEFVEGVRIDEDALEWYHAHLGFGFGWRTPLQPGHQDNALEVALTYEPGMLWFSKGDDASDSFREPVDTYEGRVHLRIRGDSIERNIMELPHQGWSAGFDGWYGNRARWKNWGGGPVFGEQNGPKHREWWAARFHALAATGLPFVESERHRLIASLYGGIGKDLDRFSAFRLGGEPSGGEWEALSRPAVAGSVFDEFYSRSYVIANLEYRYELLFFCYLHLRGQWAYLDRPRFASDGSADWEMNSLPALNAAITVGAPWNSQIELGYTYNFGLIRDVDGDLEYGGQAVTFSWSKEF